MVGRIGNRQAHGNHQSHTKQQAHGGQAHGNGQAASNGHGNGQAASNGQLHGNGQTASNGHGNGQVDFAARGILAGGRMPFVLMYHSVTPYQDDPYLVTVSPQRFEQQLTWLSERGLRGVSVGDLLAARRYGTARNLVGLTFDDGYADFVHYALPALQRHGFGATVFAIAAWLGRENSWDADGPRKPLMTADQLRQITEAGIEIGSHGLCHVSLPSVTAGTLADETVASRRTLQEVTGQKVAGFCYPYGDIDDRAFEYVRKAGYGYACAIWPSALTSRHALPRTYVGDADYPLRLRAKWMRHRLKWGLPRGLPRPGKTQRTTQGWPTDEPAVRHSA